MRTPARSLAGRAAIALSAGGASATHSATENPPGDFLVGAGQVTTSGRRLMRSRTLLPRLMKSAGAVVAAGLLVSGCATSDVGGLQANTEQPTAEGSAVAHRYANIDGRKVFYPETGSRDDPTIVLLHGFPTSSHMYRELIPLLADRFHVIAPDYIGFGYSEAPPVTEFRYAFDQLASVVDCLLSDLRVSNYIPYMQDYGGPVGFRIAAAHPERVKGLVIQNANAYADGLSDGAKGFLFPLWNERNERTLSAFRNLITIDGTKFQYLTGARDPERIGPDTWTLDQALLDRPGSAERQLALFVDYEKNLALYETWQTYLRKHQPQTLVVWGKGDPFFTVAGAEAYRRDLPRVEVTTWTPATSRWRKMRRPFADGVCLAELASARRQRQRVLPALGHSRHSRRRRDAASASRQRGYNWRSGAGAWRFVYGAVQFTF